MSTSGCTYLLPPPQRPTLCSRRLLFFCPRSILYVRNLPFNISSEEMYEIFGRYGAIRQIRV